MQELVSSAGRLLRLSGSSLDTETRADITFKDPTLLRGMSSAKVLAGRGGVLNDNCGDASTFAMSRVVSEIDVFISHNWSTPRPKKFRVLCLCFNLVPALLLTLLMGMVFAMLQAFGQLPLLDLVTDSGASYQTAPYNMVFGTVFFFAILFHWHDVRNLFRIQGPSAFLDKACIDQVDAVRKRQGIESLAAFIRHSRSMTVVYSESYLQKLWTVYELAAFMTLQPKDKLTVVPVFLADVLVMGMTLLLSISLLDTISDLPAIHQALQDAGLWFSGYLLNLMLVVPSAVIFCKLWRQWLHELNSINQQAQSFSVANGVCFKEEDRPIIQRSIARFMKGLEIVGKEASEAEALEAFNHKVHHEIPIVLEMSVGRVGILYRHACVIFLPLALGTLDYVSEAINEGETVSMIALRVASGGTTYLAVYPAILATVSLMMWLSLKLKNCILICMSYVFTGLLSVVAAIVLTDISGELRIGALHSTGGLCAFLAFCLAMFLLVAFLYRPTVIAPRAMGSTSFMATLTTRTARSRPQNASAAEVEPHSPDSAGAAVVEQPSVFTSDVEQPAV